MVRELDENQPEMDSSAAKRQNFGEVPEEHNKNDAVSKIVSAKNPEQKCVLPEEVLEKIFSLLDNPKDLFSVSRTCRQFERIVNPDKRNWLYFQVFPMIFPHLPKNAVLHCRRVSKMWKSAVDHLLENHSSVRPFDPLLDTSANPLSHQYHPRLDQIGLEPLTLTPLTFGSDPTPRTLLNKLKDHQEIPFVIRNIRSTCTDYKLNNRFWTDAFEFLTKFGKHVWTLELHFEDGRRDEDFLSFYKILRRCLRLTPNLRTITLNRDHGVSVPDDRQRYFPDFRMKQLIMQYPLPEMHHLSSILLTTTNDTTKLPITDELFRRYGQQLKMVRIFPELFDQTRLRMHFWNTNHLTEIHLSCSVGDPDTFSCRWCVEQLPPTILATFLRSTPNLPSLAKIVIDTKEPFPSEFAHEILQLLQKYPALRHLGMQLWCDYASRYWPAETLVRLDSVKTFDILVDEWGFSYDAILPYFPNLEYLKINDLRMRRVIKSHMRNNLQRAVEDEKFQVLKGLLTGQLYLSSIWSKFQNLKEIAYINSSVDGNGTFWPSIRPTNQYYYQSDSDSDITDNAGKGETFIRVTRENYEFFSNK